LACFCGLDLDTAPLKTYINPTPRLGAGNKFFDMDFQEMLICAALIWITRTWLAYFLVMMILTNWMGFRSALWDSGDSFDDDAPPSKNVKPKKSPQKLKQKAPTDDESDEGALVYPIGDKAMVVFFDPVRQETYHLGVVPA
jgi:hypothetical protein